MAGETKIGLQGEMIAACTLLSQGFKVALCQQDKVDLICWNDENEIFRVQVKSSSLRLNDVRYPCYHFNLASGSKKKTLPTVKDYDLCICVAIDHRRAYIFATEQIQQHTKRMPAKTFDNPWIEMETMEKALEIVRARK